MATWETPRSFSYIKFYFTIVSVVSVIGMVIAYAIAAYQLLKLALITDEERITQRGRYEYQNCEQPSPYPTDGNGMSKPIVEPSSVAVNGYQRTPTEIAACKEETRLRLVSQRAYETKDRSIGGLVRGSFLLVLFLTHYPRMIRLERKQVTDIQPMPKTRIAKSASTKKLTRSKK